MTVSTEHLLLFDFLSFLVSFNKLYITRSRYCIVLHFWHLFQHKKKSLGQHYLLLMWICINSFHPYGSAVTLLGIGDTNCSISSTLLVFLMVAVYEFVRVATPQWLVCSCDTLVQRVCTSAGLETVSNNIWTWIYGIKTLLAQTCWDVNTKNLMHRYLNRKWLNYCTAIVAVKCHIRGWPACVLQLLHKSEDSETWVRYVLFVCLCGFIVYISEFLSLLLQEIGTGNGVAYLVNGHL